MQGVSRCLIAAARLEAADVRLAVPVGRADKMSSSMACAHFLPGSPAGMRTVALYSVSGMARCSESISISLRLKSGGKRRGRQAGSQAGMQGRQSGSQAGSHVYIRQDQQMMNSNQLPGCCMCACAGLSLHPFLPSLIPPPHATMST